MTNSNEDKLLVTEEQGILINILMKKNEHFKKAETELLYMLDSQTKQLTSQDLFANYLLGSIYLEIQCYNKANQRFKKVVLKETSVSQTVVYKIVNLIIGVYGGRGRTKEDNYWASQKNILEEKLFKL